MKLLVVIFAVVGCTCAQFPYNPYQINSNQGFPSVYNTNDGYYQPYVNTPQTVRYNNNERYAQTVRYENEQNPDGSYQYSYQTDNGIAAQQVGTPKFVNGNTPVVAQGSFQWTSPEGQNVAIAYTADENGYQAYGDAIPTPPPVPAAILRSLEFNRREEEGRRRL